MRVSPLRGFNSCTGREFKEGHRHPYSILFNFHCILLNPERLACSFPHAKPREWVLLREYSGLWSLSKELQVVMKGLKEVLCLVPSQRCSCSGVGSGWERVCLTVLWFWSGAQLCPGLWWHFWLSQQKIACGHSIAYQQFRMYW